MTREFENSELLSAYLDGELDAEEQTAVERQLRDNPHWQQMLEDLSTLRQQLQSLPKLGPAEDFSERILRRAEREMLSEGESSKHDVAEHDLAQQANDHELQRTGDVTPIVAGGDARHAGDWRFPSLAIATLAASMLIMVVYFAGRDNEMGAPDRNLALHQPEASDGVPAATRSVQPVDRGERDAATADSMGAHVDKVELRALQLELNEGTQNGAANDQARPGGFGENKVGRNSAGGGGGGGFGGEASGRRGMSPAPEKFTRNKAAGDDVQDSAVRFHKRAESASAELGKGLAADKSVTTKTRAVAQREELRRLAEAAAIEELWVVEVSLDDARGREQVLRYLRGRTTLTANSAAVDNTTLARTLKQEQAKAQVAGAGLIEKSDQAKGNGVSIRQSGGDVAKTAKTATSDEQAESRGANVGKPQVDSVADNVRAKDVEREKIKAAAIKADGAIVERTKTKSSGTLPEQSDLELVMVEGLPAELSATLTKVSSVSGVKLRMHQEGKELATGRRFAQVSPVEFFKYYSRSDSGGVADTPAKMSLRDDGQPPAAAQAARPAAPVDDVKLQTSPTTQSKKQALAAGGSTAAPAATPAPSPRLPSSRARRHEKAGQANRGATVRRSTLPRPEGLGTAVRKAVKSGADSSGKGDDRKRDGQPQPKSRQDRARRPALANAAPPKTSQSETVQTPTDAKKGAEAKTVAKSGKATNSTTETVGGVSGAAPKSVELKRDGVGARAEDEAAAQATQPAVRPVRVLIILRTRK